VNMLTDCTQFNSLGNLYFYTWNVQIRSDVAETLYTISSLEGGQEEVELLLADTNWLDQPKELKETVNEIKTALGVE